MQMVTFENTYILIIIFSIFISTIIIIWRKKTNAAFFVRHSMKFSFRQIRDVICTKLPGERFAHFFCSAELFFIAHMCLNPLSTYQSTCRYSHTFNWNIYIYLCVSFTALTYALAVLVDFIAFRWLFTDCGETVTLCTDMSKVSNTCVMISVMVPIWLYVLEHHRRLASQSQIN